MCSSPGDTPVGAGWLVVLGRLDCGLPSDFSWSHLWSHSRRFRGVRSGLPSFGSGATRPNRTGLNHQPQNSKAREIRDRSESHEIGPAPNLQQQSAATKAQPSGGGWDYSWLARRKRRSMRPTPPLCKQRVETRLGDEVGDNGTRLPAPSLDVRGPPACANIAPAGTAARPDKAEVRIMAHWGAGTEMFTSTRKPTWMSGSWTRPPSRQFLRPQGAPLPCLPNCLAGAVVMAEGVLAGVTSGSPCRSRSRPPSHPASGDRPGPSRRSRCVERGLTGRVWTIAG